MSTQPDDTVRALREDEIARLRRLPNFPSQRPEEEKGVLLSNRIEDYCTRFRLIWPYDPKYLRPAGYDLTVGENYSILGVRTALTDGMKLEIGPYQVAIIETYETLNLPEFLIGRWNIRVALAYEGLLWVGGAQVDPGFRGHLCCPIYNLSTKPVSLEFRQPLAMIDFVTTTPYQEEKCKRFRWWERKMVVFPQYGDLRSGIEKEVNDFKKTLEKEKENTKTGLAKAAAKSEERVQYIQRRIDHFVSLTFTVVAVLFTALGIVATRGSAETSFWSSTVWVALVALYFALRPRPVWDRAREERNGGTGDGEDSPRRSRKWYTPLLASHLELVIAFLIVFGSMWFHFLNARVSANEIEQARRQASQALSALTQEKQHREAEIWRLRQESDVKVDGLQRQINLLQQSQVNRK